MTLSPPPPTYDGWCRRPRGRWRRLVTHAATDREAMERLRELTSGELAVDLCVLAPGRHPADRLGGPAERRGG